MVLDKKKPSRPFGQNRIRQWNPIAGTSNETNFTALPDGSLTINGTFSGIGDSGYWWSATDDNNAYFYSMRYNFSHVVRYSTISGKVEGLSVRCIR